MRSSRKSLLPLFLFTEAFPYGRAEPFLETEICYLSDWFSRILVIPGRVEGTPRPVPDLVEVDSSLGQQARVDRSDKLSCFFSRLFYEELVARPSRLLNWKAFKQVAFYFAEAQRIYRWLKGSSQLRAELKAALFYTYWFSPASFAIGLAKRGYPGLRLISRAHGWDLYDERHKGSYLPFRKRMLPQIDALFLASEHGRRYLLKKYPAFKSRYQVSRLGVRDPGFTTSESRDGLCRIVSCSFLSPVKRLDLLIEGLRLFSGTRPEAPIEWHHLGDGPLRDNLEVYARRRLPEAVRCFFLGLLPNSSVIDFYRTHAVDLFVNVSDSEGLPVSIMEAQSCGIPVMARAVGGIPEIVNHENGVLLQSSATPRDIADGLERIIACPSKVSAKKRASKSTWESLCNAGVNYNAFAEKIIASFGVRH